MTDDRAPTLLDRAVELLARAMDAVGLNGTRLRWKWYRRRRDVGEAGMRAEMVVRSARTAYKMCPSCRALVARSAWRCTECGEGLSRVRAPGLTRIIGNVFPGATATTGLILLANGLMFVAMVLVPVEIPGIEPTSAFGRVMRFDGGTLLRFGSGIPELTFGAGEWWRLITPLFLHGGLIHFLFNSMALLSLGPLAEEEYGTERFAFIYLASGVVGTIVAQLIGGVRTVGASGAICGLLGLLLVHGWRRGGAYGESLRQAMLRNTVLLVVLSLLPGIDWRSHLGGFLGGGVLGFVVPSGAFRSRSSATFWGALEAALLLIVLAAFLMMALRGDDTLREILSHHR